MKLAIVTTRFIKGDMRGGEEFSKSLFYSLREKISVNLLASDMMVESYNLKNLNRNFIPNPGDSDVILIKTHFLIQGAFQIMMKGFPRVTLNRFLPVEIFRSIAWGPFAPGVYNEIKRGDYDVVFSSIFPTATAFLSLKASIVSHKPFIFTPYYHYKDPRQKNNPLLHYFLKHSSALIACTEAEKNALKAAGATNEKIFIIPLSFNISDVPSDLPSQEILKERMNLNDYFVVLTHPWIPKGGLEVLRAVSILAESGKKIAVVSIGNPDREYMAEEAKLITENPKLMAIDLGWVQGRKKWEAFSVCDVFAMPSSSDAFGLSYLNAWAMKKAVIASKNTPAEEIIDDWINGKLVDPSNIKTIILALDELMVSGTADIGKRGYKKLLESYSPNEITDMYLKVFEGVTR